MTASRSFTAEERATWVPLAAILELLPRRIDGQLQRDEQLTHFDYFTLSMLALDEDRSIRMSELAALTNATLPRLSHVITRLEERGLVRREADPGDARVTAVVITPEGRRKTIHATPGHVAAVREAVLDALSPAQRAALRELAAAILDRLDPAHRVMAIPAVDPYAG